jgi:hypothetical protein
MARLWPPTRAETERRFVALLDGILSRSDVDRWAAQWVLADDLDIEDEPVNRALRRLAGIDTPDGPDGSMLYPDSQVREWLQEFRAECASTGGIPDDATVTLWRPTGPEELELLAESGWRRWPPRLPGQPIFYPVLNEQYATQIARDWNVKASGVGYVTRFEVRREFVERYESQQVGGREHRELWVPAEDLEELNDNIVGRIEVVASFGPEDA